MMSHTVQTNNKKRLQNDVVDFFKEIKCVVRVTWVQLIETNHNQKWKVKNVLKSKNVLLVQMEFLIQNGTLIQNLLFYIM